VANERRSAPDEGAIAAFAEQLRELRAKAGGPSLRTVEAAVHYSRTTIADAIGGRTLPSLGVTIALASYLGGDPIDWERRWRDAKSRLDGADDPYAGVAAALDPQEVVDGADPDAAGCHDDARTVHARKIAMSERQQVILGQVELRYSAARHAAWGRFLGYDTLKHLAHRQHVELVVAITRDPPDGGHLEHRDAYWFDYHWCDLLVTGSPARFVASATIFLDGVEVGTGRSDLLPHD
jgi:hypothetical protein